MALDSAQKRRSMLSVGDLAYGERVPLATDFATAGGRAAQVNLYFGIDPAAPSAGVVGTQPRRSIAALAMRNAIFTAQRGG